MRGRYGVLAALAVATAGVIALPGVAFADESMTARISSSNPTVGQTLTIDGDVSGAATAESMITATREDSAGTMPISGTTTSQGHFQLQDKPPARGEVVYHLMADGSATKDVTVQVAGKPTYLTIHVRPSPADADSRVQVTAHLGSATTNRDVTLSLRPYQGSKSQFDHGPVDANGDRSAGHAVHRRTTFFASFAGDSAYAPATVRTSLRVRAVLDERLKGAYRKAGETRLYHESDNPRLFVHMLPERKGNCLYFRAQHKSHGKWVRSAVSDCAKTGSDGRVIGTLRGPDHIVGTPYRLRAEWHGTKAVARRAGEWMHLEFRR
jgi:hypothetical protein